MKIVATKIVMIPLISGKYFKANKRYFISTKIKTVLAIFSTGWMKFFLKNCLNLMVFKKILFQNSNEINSHFLHESKVLLS